MSRLRMQVLCLSLVFGLVLVFQACQPLSIFSGVDESSNNHQMSGDGRGFEGKPTGVYVFLDPAEPCADRGANGLPLPNEQISLYGASSEAATSAALVRQACLDLEKPEAIPLSSIAVAATGATLTFQGRTFSERNSIGDFDVIAAQCPASLLPVPNAQRKNLFVNPHGLDLAPWSLFPGLSIGLTGTMAGLPRFILSRNDGNQLDTWHSLVQYTTFTPGRALALTFFARPGAATEVMVGGDDDGKAFTLQIVFNLVSGESRVIYNPTNIPVASYSRPFAGGFIGTFYFTPPSGSTSGNLGITPFNNLAPGAPAYGALGDSVLLTAIQLEDLSTICR